MKLGIINCPNTPRLIKCTCICLGTLIILSLSGQFKESVISPRLSQLYAGYISRLSSRRSVCVAFIGRLGNQMFQYASAFGIARMNNMTIRVGNHDSIAKYFKISATVYRSYHYCNHADRVYEKQHCAFDPGLLNISTTRDTMLLEYLQSWKYFRTVLEELRQEFTFKDKIITEARAIFNNITSRGVSHKKENATYIGLHIRRGDMVHGSNITQQSYNVAGMKYILQAINLFLTKFPNAMFVVCSDDIKWAKEELLKYTTILNLAFTDKNRAYIDLAILSLCDHVIMTTGTFGWWAGWLAGGTVVYYKSYIKEDSALRKEFSKDFSDYFYPGWIGLE